MGTHLWWGLTLPDAEPYFSGPNFPASREMEKPITGVTIPWCYLSPPDPALGEGSDSSGCCELRVY